MDLLSSFISPFEVQLSFYHIFENLDKVAADPDNENAARATSLLHDARPFPELRNGITDISQIEENAGLIRRLLADYFPENLTYNEIKAVTFPYSNVIFNHSERFKNIIKAAGPDLNMNIRDFNQQQFYVFSCCLILNEFYGTALDFSQPLFYEIPTASGINKYYRILYNADFMEILATERSPALTRDEVDNLVNNYDDLDLWKKKIPPGTFLLKGFAMITLYDATVENVVSILKEKLLSYHSFGFRNSIESIFRSIYRVADIRVGFTSFDKEDDMFSLDKFGQQLPSFILPEGKSEAARKLLCEKSYFNLIELNTSFSINDTAEYLANNPVSYLANHFTTKNIGSFILAPLIKNKHMYGILEIVSPRSKVLNSINANLLDIVMPFLIDTIERIEGEFENQTQAVIQNQFTTIHNSVYWKFYAEAQKLILAHQIGEEYTLQEIVFPTVHPLYGQIDIKGSSEARNESVQKDLKKQLKWLLPILEEVNKETQNSFEKEENQISQYLIDIYQPLKAGTEHYISQYLDNTVHEHLRKIKDPDLIKDIQDYFVQTDKNAGEFHKYRKKYETTIQMINEKIASVLDENQIKAQRIFPHYYERFKTDGIEHNLYIGSSIAPKLEFDLLKLYQLRLWQLRTLCKMEAAHHHLKPQLPYDLEVTTLVLVYHATIDIRFRMDEKRFDIDGSYNARYEIVKKRIDKAFIQGTTERITKTGFITIVYLNETEEKEYVEYLRILQAEHILEKTIEKMDVEDLQGISGLKALRVGIVH
ncbi:GAF domain-containing protein [Dyadobacter frigoris]|uniref:GAF domain-containing protein n=1 Tax=Dyadobacter frigoris TaxID=2576211 RepID=A0A4V6BJZ0_9BACT|nr:GAF domain-containing protein [Dyadobacter frigoris]TKT90763.1 GAF domain-containing protein [Dyadobacter frigoris]GLU52097.1 hypothetical protein Dfri01_15580 [Dyadobacter frigoris]